MAGQGDAPGAVAVRGPRIVWMGSSSEVDRLVGSRTRLIDCSGRTLLPGLIDAHLHLLAYASSLVAVDCSPSSAGSIGQIGQALGRRADGTPAGEWIRGYGYDDLSLLERRHPTRRDLDGATPAHPVRLNHRSGHASVLNSLALNCVGIDAGTPDPIDGVIDRDDDGEPTGLLFEMSDYLDGRVPSLTDEQLRRGVSEAGRDLLSQGNHLGARSDASQLDGAVDDDRGDEEERPVRASRDHDAGTCPSRWLPRRGRQTRLRRRPPEFGPREADADRDHGRPLSGPRYARQPSRRGPPQRISCCRPRSRIGRRGSRGQPR